MEKKTSRLRMPGQVLNENKKCREIKPFNVHPTLSLVAHSTIEKAFKSILKDFLRFSSNQACDTQRLVWMEIHKAWGLQYIPEDCYFESTEPED